MDVFTFRLMEMNWSCWWLKRKGKAQGKFLYMEKKEVILIQW